MKLLRRIQYLLKRRRMESELTEEIDHHREMRGDDRAMGDAERAFREARAVWAVPALDRLRSAVTRSGRGGLKRPQVLKALKRPLRWLPRSHYADILALWALFLSWRLLTGTPLTVRIECTLAGIYVVATLLEHRRLAQREFTTETPEEKRIFVEDSEAVLELAKLRGFESVAPFTPYLGKWMTVSGEFEGVADSLQGDAIHLTLVLDDGRPMNVRFPSGSRERLQRLKPGDRIAAIGQIQHKRYTLCPERCELIRVEPARRASRLTLAS